MYAENWECIFGWLLRKTRDHDIAEDICIQVFDIALRKGNWHDRAEWAERGFPYYKWLTKVAYYKVIDWEREQLRRPRPFYDAADNDGDGIDEDHDSALADPHTAALFDQIENAMTYAFIKAALPKLPKHHQKVITLHYGHGISTANAAAQLHMNHVAYRSLLDQAIAHLSAVMAVQGWCADG